MGAAPNPLMAHLAPLLMARIAAQSQGGPGGGPPGGPGTGPAGTPSDIAASAGYGRELSSARQADPAALGQKVSSVKQMILELINQTGMSNPGVVRALAKTFQGLDAAVKEAASAAATLQVASPIQASAASGAPGAGSPSPSPFGPPGM